MRLISDFEIFNGAVVIFFIAWGLVFFYQSWVNLAKHQWAVFSWDNLAFSFASLVRGKQYAKAARKLVLTDPKQLQRYGRLALARGIVCMGIAIYWYVHFLR